MFSGKRIAEIYLSRIKVIGPEISIESNFKCKRRRDCKNIAP